MEAIPIEDRIESIFALIAQTGTQDYIGEAISQLEHMCQSAQLAEKDGQNEEVILAAFFHDIGHLCEPVTATNDMAGFGHLHHEKAGADYLRTNGFSDKVALLVENHVQAKRYLCGANPNYYERLSKASLETLGFQGGLMTKEEQQTFEQDPLFKLHLKVRAWDELAKEVDVPLPDMEVYKGMVRRHLES